VKERLAVPPARNGQSESDELVSVKRAKDLSARRRRDDKQRFGDNINIIGLPDRALQAQAGLEFRNSLAVSD
jgi:hypothetical protein